MTIDLHRPSAKMYADYRRRAAHRRNWAKIIALVSIAVSALIILLPLIPLLVFMLLRQ